MKKLGDTFVTDEVPNTAIQVGGVAIVEDAIEAEPAAFSLSDDEVSLCLGYCWDWKDSSSDPFVDYEEIQNRDFPPLIGSDGQKVAYADAVVQANYTLMAKQRLERNRSGCNSNGLCWTGMGYILALCMTTTLILILTSWIYAEIRALDRCFATKSLSFNSTVATDLCAKELQGQHCDLRCVCYLWRNRAIFCCNDCLFYNHFFALQVSLFY